MRWCRAPGHCGTPLASEVCSVGIHCFPPQTGESFWDPSQRSGVPVSSKVSPGSAPALLLARVPCLSLTSVADGHLLCDPDPKDSWGSCFGCKYRCCPGTCAQVVGPWVLPPSITSIPVVASGCPCLHSACRVEREWPWDIWQPCVPRTRTLLLGPRQASEQLFISHSLKGMAVSRPWFLSPFYPRTP